MNDTEFFTRDYGPPGDWSTVEEAVAAAVSAGGGTVVVASAAWDFPTGWRLPPGVRLRGESPMESHRTVAS